MNKLRIVHKLSLQDCHRVVHSIFEVNNSRNNNLNNVQIVSNRRLDKSSKFPISGYFNGITRPDVVIPLQNVSSISMKRVTPCLNKKIRLFAESAIGRKYGGILCQQNFVLSSSCHQGSFNYTNVRRYSDESLKTIAVPQLDGFWKTLSESAPVEISQNALIWLHSATGLPWWATIVLATWSVRGLVTLPLAIHQTYVLAKFYNLKDELEVIVKDLKQETNYAVFRYKWPEKYARAIYNRSFKKQRQKLIERDNCHPMKSIILVMVQIPMWITLSASMRNLCFMLPYPTESAHAIYLELTTGGFGWMMNLTVPDSTFTIPVTLGLLNLTIIEMQNLMRLSEPTKTQKVLTNVFRFIALAMIPLASYVPSAMSLYWASSSCFGVVQNFLLLSPNIRRLVRIPETETEIQKPYEHLYTNLRRKIGLKVDPLPEEVKKIVTTSKCTIKNR